MQEEIRRREDAERQQRVEDERARAEERARAAAEAAAARRLRRNRLPSPPGPRADFGSCARRRGGARSGRADHFGSGTPFPPGRAPGDPSAAAPRRKSPRSRRPLRRRLRPCADARTGSGRGQACVCARSGGADSARAGSRSRRCQRRAASRRCSVPKSRSPRPSPPPRLPPLRGGQRAQRQCVGSLGWRAALHAVWPADSAQRAAQPSAAA
ncbi:Uncharacterised protein [Sphingomonas paucimobilis]|nr:Uncharacterised protein [Sphingomonas paucimobilis]